MKKFNKVITYDHLLICLELLEEQDKEGEFDENDKKINWCLMEN